MKKQIKICLMLILAILIFSINNKVNAAIAIKEAGSSALTGKTISEFFDMAQQMTQSGQALEGTSLDPHMATNKEWAAVSYLSNSNYGTAGEGQNTGITVTINGNSHYSTTDNITGVIDWGKTGSYTAGILSDADTKITDEIVRANGQSLINNMADNTKVDVITTESSTDYYGGTQWFGYSLIDMEYGAPYSVRQDLLNMRIGKKQGYGGYPWNKGFDLTGSANKNLTFRPVL